MKPLVLPQVNINGTSRDALIEQQVKVLRAFDKLREAMAEAMPHGRDYQSQPLDYKRARDAWTERLETVFAMRKEIEQYAQTISRGGE